jgi:hypothetical protein
VALAGTCVAVFVMVFSWIARIEAVLC